jgi:magnesium transporter
VSDAKTGPIGSSTPSGNLIEALLAASTERIASHLKTVHPADAVPVLTRLSRERAAEVAEQLDPRTAALLLRELHPAFAASVCAAMQPSKASKIFAEMAPDDRVDILSHVPATLREQVIQELSATEAAEVRRLASYPSDSAGGIMTTEAVALAEVMTAEHAVAELRCIGQEVEQVYYVYAVGAA